MVKSHFTVYQGWQLCWLDEFLRISGYYSSREKDWSSQNYMGDAPR